MNFKKIAAGITAAVCCAGMMTCLPKLSEKTFAQSAVCNDFEVNYDGWYGNSEAVILTAEPQKGFDGTRGMTVSGRQSAKDGVSSSKGFYLSGGVNYNYSIKVYSKTNEKFRLSLLCADMETDEETTVQLAEKEVIGGQWTEISAEYTAPKNSYEFKLTLTTDSLNDFSFDDVNITSEQNTNAVYAATAQKGLKDEFAPYFRVGNILNGGTVKNSAITANIIKDYNSIECENEFKPDATLNQSQNSNTNIGVNLNSAAAIIDFCIQNNIAMRGHTLVWHSQTPQWFFKENFDANANWVNTATMDQRMESYIKNMFALIEKQYPSLNLYAYDVANECVSDSSDRTANNGGAREPGINNGLSPWVQVYGSNAFVEKAFTYARKYAPEGCALYYNDYNEYWDHKRDCIYNMCKDLYNKNLLDGVGMQSHVPANATGFAGTVDYIAAMKKYLSIGCDVQITELDISIKDNYTYQQQADKYKAIFQAAMDWNKNPQSDGRVTLVAIWGPNDANSWLPAGSNGLLYDSNNQPKTAYTTLTAMIPQSEWGDGSNYQGGEVKPIEPNDFGWYFDDGFEGDLCSWNSRGPAKISTSGKTSYVGSESLLVQNRESAWNGASKALNPRAFEQGKEYSFSANVMYFDGDATDKFYLKLQYTDADGETQYSTIAEATAIKGEWVQLANMNYKIPDDATDMQLYVETAESTIDFYVDEVIGAVGGTGILGAGESKEIILGDVNFDGKLNVFDVILLKKGINNGFESKSAEIAADVDQNTIIETNDVLYLQQFLTKQIKEFPIGEKPIPPTPPVAEMRTMSEYTPIVQKAVTEFETADSKQEKAGVQYGTVKSGTYYSTTCNRNKPYNILLPANYSENKKYPVLYVLHGYWENQDRMIIEGNGTMYTRQIIGNAIAEGAAEDMIVVFPYVYSSATQDSCTAMDDANNAAYDNFINDLIKDLMPHIEQTYSVKTGRENTAITGFSMGGRESLLIGMQRADLFGYVGAICPAPGVTGSFKWDSEKEAPSLLFITAGSNDTVVYDNPKNYHENFAKNNVPHIWHYVNGGYHGDNSIHAHIYNFVRAVFKA